jgi:hypothetical protein
MKANERPDDLAEHVATFARQHHYVLSDDANFYVYARRPQRRAVADGEPTRLELLSQRLKDLNERNREFWSQPKKEKSNG